jgi:hypothetical protein
MVAEAGKRRMVVIFEKASRKALNMICDRIRVLSLGSS